jgi:CheY-like chemotaxis protein
VPRILLVDDDRDHLKLFTLVLQGGGYFVDAFSDPIAALSKFRPNTYDLVILDYRMPKLDGFELYKLIRKTAQETKALIITATHELIIDKNGEELWKQSNVRIIIKPLSNEDLLKEINSILN